jgi:predicted phage tail protein
MSATQLTSIKVYGELADFLGFTVFDAAVADAAEAVRCLMANFPKLEAHMGPRYYKVIVDDVELEPKEYFHPTNSAIKIVPVVGGEGGRGLGSILAGAALIGLSMGAFGAFGTKAISFGAGGGGFAAAGWGAKAAFSIGASLALGGISQMLTPVPPKPTEDTQDSFAFSSPVNISRAGSVVPILYGQRLIGSTVISAGIHVEEVET